MSRAWAEIDHDAIAANVALLKVVANGSELCAVVKANAYGHGLVDVANTVLNAGAKYLAVAHVDEGAMLRRAGIGAPIWILSEPDPKEFVAAAGHNLEPAVYSERGLVAAESVSRAAAIKVHLKLDTGMHRVGVSPENTLELAKSIDSAAGLELISVWTHLANADLPEDPFTNTQLDHFEAALSELADANLLPPLTHAANSAATIAWPRAHRDVVRCGIALYGLQPSPDLADRLRLHPAMSIRTAVAFVKRLKAGDRVSYGRRQALMSDSNLATLPIGYADGFRRLLWKRGGSVLIHGAVRPVVGAVTMDQIVVDMGDDDVAPGDEVVVIGNQGTESITFDDWAANLETINYELACSIGGRIERVHRRSREQTWADTSISPATL